VSPDHLLLSALPQSIQKQLDRWMLRESVDPEDLRLVQKHYLCWLVLYEQQCTSRTEYNKFSNELSVLVDRWPGARESIMYQKAESRLSASKSSGGRHRLKRTVDEPDAVLTSHLKAVHKSTTDRSSSANSQRYKVPMRPRRNGCTRRCLDWITDLA